MVGFAALEFRKEFDSSHFDLNGQIKGELFDAFGYSLHFNEALNLKFFLFYSLDKCKIGFKFWLHKNNHLIPYIPFTFSLLINN